MGRGGDRGEIGDMAEDVGILDDDATRLAVDRRDQRGAVIARRTIVEPGQSGAQIVAGEARHRPAHRYVMRMQPGREQGLAAPGDPPRHHDRLPAGGRSVVHRSVGDIAAVEARDLGLELEQHLQSALRDLGLIGRVACQEFATLDDMVDARRDMMTIRAGTEEEGLVARRLVHPREPGELPLHRLFGLVDRQIVDRAG